MTRAFQHGPRTSYPFARPLRLVPLLALLLLWASPATAQPEIAPSSTASAPPPEAPPSIVAPPLAASSVPAAATGAPAAIPPPTAPASATVEAPHVEPTPSGGAEVAPPLPPAPPPPPPDPVLPTAPPAPEPPPEPPAPADSAASAPAAPSIIPSAIPPPSKDAMVRVHEREVFGFRVPRAGQTPQARALAASHAMKSVLEGGGEIEARVEEQGGLAVVFVGRTPIATLGPEDAEAEGVTLSVHAASVATRVQEALRTERKRSAIATTVFSFSLLIFSGLIAFLLMRRVGEVLDRLRAWMEARPERLPALRLGTIEVVSSAAVRGALAIALRIGHRVAQVAILYGWVLIALSLFESTRGYTERLTGFVLTPLSALMARIGSALPVLVITLIAVLAVTVLVRFVGLFFGSVARGETNLGWLPSDLAGPTSVIVRAGIVVVSLILASPLITGTDEGALARAGVAALVAVGLACTPVLACAAVGIPVVFGRRLRPGDYAEAGGRAGRIRGLTLLEVRLEDPFGCEVRVPHLLGLWHPTRVLGRSPLTSMEVVVDPRAPQGMVQGVLINAARTISPRAKVELISLDADGARYRVTCPDDGARSLAAVVADALREEAITLGRRGGGT